MILHKVEQESDDDFSSQSGSPHLINQPELNDLVQDLNLSKSQAELFDSRLQQWNLLEKGTKISVFRSRQEGQLPCFKMKGDLCYCSDIDGLMLAMGVERKPSDWRLSIPQIEPSASHKRKALAKQF